MTQIKEQLVKINEYFNKLLEKDITIKALSIFFGIMLWVFVLENSANPFDTKTINVRIEFLNKESLEEKQMGIRSENYPKEVTLYVKGRRNVIGKYNESDYKAYVDFSKINQEGEVKIDVKKPDGIAIDDVRPRTIRVDLEKKERKQFSVEVVKSGEPKNGYKVYATDINKEIEIYDFESIVNSIASVKAFVDINNADGDLTYTKKCKFYDYQGQEITWLENANNEVQITVRIGKKVPIIVSVHGTPASGATRGKVTVKPNELVLTGPNEVLNGISKFNVEPIDISGATRDVYIKKVLNIPENITIVEGSKEVEITVSIEKLSTRTITLNRSNIEIQRKNDKYKYEIINQNIDLIIKGNKDIIESLDPSTVKPVCDVSGLIEGTHNVPIKINTDNGLELAEQVSINIRVEKQ